MKFAIIGMGFIYPRHKQSIERLGHQVALTCDIDEAKQPDFTDWVKMINSPQFKEIDAISICTPNYLHSMMIRECLLKGKKVLCEKPLSINGTQNLGDVKCVLQLRKHPQLINFKKPKQLLIEAKMFRDDKYWNGWKGSQVMSGGILYNLGVHYVDLLIFLLGNKYEILFVEKSDKKVVADIKFGKSLAHIHIEIVDSPTLQGRILIADDEEITLSNQENLSYEDLHIEVYRDFIEGKGIGLKEASKSLTLVEKILA